MSPKVVGGIGEKKSNKGTQWYNQDRIYDGRLVSVAITSSFQPYYMIMLKQRKKIKEKKK